MQAAQSGKVREEEDGITKITKKFADKLLHNRVFIGNYKEIRFVNDLMDYRDVVVLNNTEKLLKEDLETVIKKIRGTPQFQTKWIGINEPGSYGAPAMYHLYTDVGNIPFGIYWFQIRGIQFIGNEIFLKLQCLRPLNSESIPEMKSHSDSEMSDLSDNRSDTDIGLKQVQEKFQELKNEILSDVLSALNYNNMKNIFWFLSVFIITCVTAFLNSLQYIGEFSLKLLRELNSLLQTLSPIIFAVLDFMAKCVGGFYMLLCVLLGNRTQPSLREKFLSESQIALPAPKNRYMPQPRAPHNSTTRFR